MGGISLSAAYILGYISLFLIIAAFFRSQFKFLQKLLIPSNILAGFFLLIMGPSVLNIVNLPVGVQVDSYVYHLLTAIFIVLGLRGFGKKGKSPGTATTTILISNTLAIQAIIGIIFTMLVIYLIRPDFFAGFGSLLMLGYGFDPVMARFFGGFWQEQHGFANGRFIGFSFGVIGFLAAYLIGVAYIILAKIRGKLPDLSGNQDDSFLSGIIARKNQKEEAGRLTTDSQSIETMTLHLGIVGIVMLITYFFMSLVGFWLVRSFDASIIIVGEMFMNLHFLYGLLLGVAVRKIMQFMTLDYLLDEGILGRINGVLVDYMVVAAIVAIPLVISGTDTWETLILAVIGGILTLLAVNWFLRRYTGEKNNVANNVAVFGFLTGNISSSIALLRIVDPRLENSVIRDIAYAGGLVMFTAIPLLFLINLPLIEAGLIYMIYTFALMIAYILLLSLIWFLVIRRRFAVSEAQGEARGEVTKGSKRIKKKKDQASSSDG